MSGDWQEPSGKAAGEAPRPSPDAADRALSWSLATGRSPPRPPAHTLSAGAPPRPPEIELLAPMIFIKKIRTRDPSSYPPLNATAPVLPLSPNATACSPRPSGLRPRLPASRARSSPRSGLLHGTELRARRKPKLSFRVSGLMSYRLADRAKLASLRQLPPRNIRSVPEAAPCGSLTAPLP